MSRGQARHAVNHNELDLALVAIVRLDVAALICAQQLRGTGWQEFKSQTTSSVGRSGMPSTTTSLTLPLLPSFSLV